MYNYTTVSPCCGLFLDVNLSFKCLFSYEHSALFRPVFPHARAGVADVEGGQILSCDIRFEGGLLFRLLCGWGVKRFVDARGANAGAGRDKRCMEGWG